MIPWQLIDTAPIPGDGGRLQFHRRGDEFSISIVGGGVLMNSRAHGSEEALAELACRQLSGRPQPKVLIGGLGMGFTLAAALKHLGSDAEVLVAELVPGVVEWNRGPLGGCAGNPLNDPRSSIHTGDVAKLLRTKNSAFDAILLDVDNGPEGLTRRQNDWLYLVDGLTAAYQALRPGGILAVWSAGPDRDFDQRLVKVGFMVRSTRARARGKKGEFHMIWLAEKPD